MAIYPQQHILRCFIAYCAYVPGGSHFTMLLSKISLEKQEKKKVCVHWSCSSYVPQCAHQRAHASSLKSKTVLTNCNGKTTKIWTLLPRMPLIFRITKNSTKVFSTIRSYQRSLFQAIKRGTRSQENHFPLYECSHSTWGKRNLQFSQLQRGCFNFPFLCADKWPNASKRT